MLQCFQKQCVRTDVEAIDRLTIIVHDRFQDIIDRANDPNSIIKKHIEIGTGGDIPPEKTDIVTVPSQAEALLMQTVVTRHSGINVASDLQNIMLRNTNFPILTPEEQEIAAITWNITKRIIIYQVLKCFFLCRYKKK